MQYATDEGKDEFKEAYGRISTASTGAILRKIIEMGDKVLLCSDGLHSVLGDVETACNSLIELANANGGPDNITVTIADIGKVDGSDNIETTRRNTREYIA